MRAWLLTILMVLPGLLRAQSANDNLSVTANTALSFLLTNPIDLENDQVLPNAITLTVESKNSNCTVHARLSSFIYPAGYTPDGSVLALDWQSDNSNKDYNLVTAPIQLETYDKLLFMQKKMHGNKIYDYNYNLVLEAPGYTFVPGSYSFTILFTMTQP